MSEENLATQESVVVEPVAESTESLDTRDIISREIEKHESPEQKADRVRDEKGKFAVKPAISTGDSADKSTTQDPQKTTKDVSKDTGETAKPAKSPFSAWKKEAQAALSALPPEVQNFITEREGQFHKGIEQYKSDAQLARSINKAIAPHADYMQQLGVSPDAAFASLLGTERTLRTGSPREKAEMFQKLAHDYGIDMGQLAQAPFDPQRHELELQNKWLQSQIRSAQASQQSAEVAELEQNIAEFAQSHEYFGQVSDTMADLISKGFANNLDEAYEKAIRLNDDVFSKYQSQQFGESKRQDALRADQAAKAAKAAAVSVRGAPTGLTHQPTPATTEEAVRLAMRQHGLI